MIQTHPTLPGHYLLETDLIVPRPIDEVFDFFADAFQLERITPPWLHFKVITPAPIEIAEGTLIDYRLKLHGVPIRWQSRISVWEPGQRFVDEQMRGPYHKWYHEHTFESCLEGTRVGDRVTYRPRGGRLIHKMFVRPDLEKIFRYRTEQLAEILGAENAAV